MKTNPSTSLLNTAVIASVMLPDPVVSFVDFCEQICGSDKVSSEMESEMNSEMKISSEMDVSSEMEISYEMDSGIPVESRNNIIDQFFMRQIKMSFAYHGAQMSITAQGKREDIERLINALYTYECLTYDSFDQEKIEYINGNPYFMGEDDTIIINFKTTFALLKNMFKNSLYCVLLMNGESEEMAEKYSNDFEREMMNGIMQRD